MDHVDSGGPSGMGGTGPNGQGGTTPSSCAPSVIGGGQPD